MNTAQIEFPDKLSELLTAVNHRFLRIAMNTAQTKLPDKLSELLTVAIEDGRRLNRVKYMPDHGHWHFKPTYWNNPDQPCYVCLAGAVMAETLKIGIDVEMRPGGFGSDTRKKLIALEYMRKGCYRHACDELGIEELGIRADPELFPERNKALCSANSVIKHRHFENWSEFIGHLDSMAAARDILREAGL